MASRKLTWSGMVSQAKPDSPACTGNHGNSARQFCHESISTERNECEKPIAGADSLLILRRLSNQRLIINRTVNPFPTLRNREPVQKLQCPVEQGDKLIRGIGANKCAKLSNCGKSSFKVLRRK